MTDAERLQAHAPGAWRQRLLDWAGPRVEVAEAADRAGRIRSLPLSPELGTCWFPLVADPQRIDASLPGVLVQVRAEEGMVPVPAAVDAAARRWVSGLVGLDSAPVTAPLSLHNLPPGWQVEGTSLGLACAVALVGQLLGRTAWAPVLTSASLAAPGRVDPVDGIEAKNQILDGELWATQAVHRWIAAEATDVTDLLRAWFGGSCQRDLLLALGSEPNQLSRRAVRAYFERDYAKAEGLADLAIDATQGDPLATAWWIAGACRLHRGASDEALPLIQRAWRYFQESYAAGRRLFLVQELTAYLGIGMIDQLRPVEAVQALEEALAQLDEVPPAYRGQAWRSSALQVAGSLRRARAFVGDLAGALAVQRDRALGDAALEEERARCLLDLADVHLKLGDLAAAKASLIEAEAALPATTDDHRPATRRFLAIQMARAGMLGGAVPLAAPDFRNWPQPLEVLQVVILEGREAFEAYVSTHLDPTALPPILCLAVSGEAARAVQLWGRLPWATALAERLVQESGAGLDPEGLAALLALAEGDGAPWHRRAPY